jgi:hypothetical protein
MEGAKLYQPGNSRATPEVIRREAKLRRMPCELAMGGELRDDISVVEHPLGRRLGTSNRPPPQSLPGNGGALGRSAKPGSPWPFNGLNAGMGRNDHRNSSARGR